MTRDMKPPRTHRASGNRKKSAGGTLVGLFLGLVIGVIGAAAVVWYINRTPMPFASKPTPTTPIGQATPAAAGNASAGNNSGSGGSTPMALPGKPGDPVPERAADDGKPRFDFYKILPGNADAIPDPKADTQKPTEADKGKAEKDAKDAKDANALKDPVYLQTGSFQNASDADNQKAKLALMGTEASVQQVMLQDKVWYRVRLGPFRKLDEVNNLRADLAKQGIEAHVVKKD